MIDDAGDATFFNQFRRDIERHRAVSKASATDPIFAQRADGWHIGILNPEFKVYISQAISWRGPYPSLAHAIARCPSELGGGTDQWMAIPCPQCQKQMAVERVIQAELRA